MPIEKLSTVQKGRVKRLEPALKAAVDNGDLGLAKKIIIDLKGIYLSTGNIAKFAMAKNRLFEAAMECGDIQYAIDGFDSVIRSTDPKTRVHLEATTLLAICYLRKNLLDKAEPLINQVLNNGHVIKSSEKRTEFNKLVIERFDEEALLFGLKSSVKEKIIAEEIESEATALADNFSETEIFENIGKVVPSSAKNILERIDNFSKKQLPSAQRLMLQSPINAADNKQVGQTVFSLVKRVVYTSICDKKSESYKSWRGASIGTIKSYITIAVAEAFVTLSIGIKAILISIVALIIKLGLEIYCEYNKPSNIMNIR